LTIFKSFGAKATLYSEYYKTLINLIAKETRVVLYSIDIFAIP